MKEVHAAQCPLCGGPNHCALAADPNATECWCDSVVFPPELLARIPEDALHRACVCPRCLAQFEESQRDPHSASDPQSG